jgi:N-acyl-D-aspartate/D-glutamate deacylase
MMGTATARRVGSVLDIALRNGIIVDGTGAAAYRADVGIAGGDVVTIGDVGAATRSIDVDGAVVAPGFVDVHTHIDAQVFWDPMLGPSSLHGVTSMLAGNCGFTLTPLSAESGDYLLRMLAIVEGMPLDALRAGVPCDWSTTAEYLDRLEGALAVNTGFMVGHSALRRVVMGPAATQRAATRAELDAMVALLRDGLAAGGLGFSSSWGIVHTDDLGDPVPSRFADADEIVELAAQCRDFEGTSLEFIPKYTDRFDVEQAELLARMSVAARRPLNWNVLRAGAAERDATFEALRMGSYAAERGGTVVALNMPIPSRARFSFATGFVLNALPGWGEVLTRPHTERLAALRDPAIRRALAAGAASATMPLLEIAEWHKRVITETFSPETKRYQGRNVADIAREEAKDPFDALLDIVCADDLRTTFTRLETEPSAADWEAIVEVWRDGRAIIGASDAGAHLDFTAYFDYPVYVLEHAVRRHGLVSLEEAVRLLTSVPAGLYGLCNRGTVREGSRADLVVFDPDTVASGEITTRFDLPAGAGRLYAEPRGVHHVLVNGTPIVEHGAVTGARPGRVLRSGRDTSSEQPR